MKMPLAIIAFLISSNLIAQSDLKYAGKQFIAISVSNTDSTSKWYEEIFKMKLLKEIKVAENNVHIRIIGNEFVKIEILQHGASRALAGFGIDKDDSYMIRGYFKTGFYVTDLSKAEKYFRSKNVTIKHGPFDDKETNSKSIIIEDINGYLVQVLEEMK